MDLTSKSIGLASPAGSKGLPRGALKFWKKTFGQIGIAGTSAGAIVS
jgi:hypothetical protein